MITILRIHKKDIMKCGLILALHYITVRNDLLNFDGQNAALTKSIKISKYLLNNFDLCVKILRERKPRKFIKLYLKTMTKCNSY